MSKKKSPETSDHQEIADRHQADPIQGDAANSDHNNTLDPTAPDGNPTRQGDAKKHIKFKELSNDQHRRYLFLVSARRAREFLEAHMRLRCYIEAHYPPENKSEMRNDVIQLRSLLDPLSNPHDVFENTIETLMEEELS